MEFEFVFNPVQVLFYQSMLGGLYMTACAVFIERRRARV